MKEVNNRKLIVNIISQSACSTCHAQGACTVSDFQDKEIEISDFRGTYHVGEEVTIIFKESKGFAALAWGYLVPFLLVLATLIIATQFTANELKSGLFALGILIPYYTALYFLRHHLKKIFKFELEEIN
ncbi:MAG TPA: SoxR reducing system RseC family protein [Draconibacterium sp.]|nr:SoxR reducing system RseC family protein [Draconibacterium sp.]